MRAVDPRANDSAVMSASPGAGNRKGTCGGVAVRGAELLDAKLRARGACPALAAQGEAAEADALESETRALIDSGVMTAKERATT